VRFDRPAWPGRSAVTREGDGALRFPSSCPSRDSRPRRGGDAQLPARLLALVGFASPSEVRGADRVARSVAPRAPPHAVRRPRGLPRSTWLSWPVEVAGDPLLEFVSPSEPNHVSAAVPRSRSRPACADRDGRPGPENRLSWGSLSLEHCLRRVPRSPQDTPGCPDAWCGRWRSPGPHRCRPQGSCPSRRFWLRSRLVRDPAGPRRLPWRPDASRPCFMPLAPLESPFRAFPSRGAVPALAGLVLPCGFAFDRPTARPSRGIRGSFRRRADLSPELSLGPLRDVRDRLDCKAGTTGPRSH